MKNFLNRLLPILPPKVKRYAIPQEIPKIICGILLINLSCFGQIPLKSASYENLKKVASPRITTIGEFDGDVFFSAYLGYGNAQFFSRGGNFKIAVNKNRADSICTEFNEAEISGVKGISIGFDFGNYKLNRFYGNIGMDLGFGNRITRNLFYLHLGQNKEFGEKLFLRYFGGLAFGNAVMDVDKFATKSEQFEIAGKLFKPNFLEVAMVTNPFILRAGFSVGYRLSRIFNLSISAYLNYNVINRVDLRFSGTDAGITQTSQSNTLKLDLRSNNFVYLNNRNLQDNLFGFNGLQWSINIHYMAQ